ncbi:MAG: hypothetical protein AAGE59_19275 [Cyanobacteria bacterium P01_F01_bin.86]
MEIPQAENLRVGDRKGLLKMKISLAVGVEVRNPISPLGNFLSGDRLKRLVRRSQ